MSAVLLMMNTTGQDGWLRADIRNVPTLSAPILQLVVCVDHFEADRIFSQWAQAKYRQGLSVGGACTVRYDGPATIALEKARYAS